MRDMDVYSVSAHPVNRRLGFERSHSILFHAENPEAAWAAAFRWARGVARAAADGYDTLGCVKLYERGVDRLGTDGTRAIGRLRPLKEWKCDWPGSEPDADGALPDFVPTDPVDLYEAKVACRCPEDGYVVKERILTFVCDGDPVAAVAAWLGRERSKRPGEYGETVRVRVAALRLGTIGPDGAPLREESVLGVEEGNPEPIPADAVARVAWALDRMRGLPADRSGYGDALPGAVLGRVAADAALGAVEALKGDLDAAPGLYLGHDCLEILVPLPGGRIDIHIGDIGGDAPSVRVYGSLTGQKLGFTDPRPLDGGAVPAVVLAAIGERIRSLRAEHATTDAAV